VRSHSLRWIAAEALVLEGVAADAPRPEELPRVEPPLAPRDEAIFLLHAAAEVEHELMLQYLYAAYSLPEDAEPPVADWRNTLLDVAREEMGHFLTVQNLLRIIGGPLRLGRGHSPDVADLHPFPYALEPFTRGALAKYIVAEMPHGAQDIDDIIGEAERAAGRSSGALHRVGRIYVRIEELLRGFRLFERAVELRGRQGTAAEWGGGATMFADPIEDPAAAMAALRRIALQGEGLDVNDDVASHFERFLRMYRNWPDGVTPAQAVPTNPHALDFDEPQARAWAELLNVRYRLLLATLGHGLTLAGNEDERRPLLVRASLAEMRFLAAIAQKLPALPLGGNAVAGAPFELPYTTDLPDQEEDRWRHYLDVLERSRELRRALGSGTSERDAVLLASIAAADEELRAASAEWSRDPNSLPVLVVGTGPAGLAAAAALARSGVPVRLIDSSPVPGGKVNSERRDGRSLEHGIHGWWVNYLNFDRLMRWCGVDPATALQEANGSAMVLPDGRHFPLRTLSVNLPSPLFLVGQILGSDFLSNLNLITAVPFFLHVLAFDHARDYDTYDTLTFEQLMDRTRVSRDLRDRLLEPFILSFDFAVSSRVRSVRTERHSVLSPARSALHPRPLGKWAAARRDLRSDPESAGERRRAGRARDTTGIGDHSRRCRAGRACDADGRSDRRQHAPRHHAGSRPAASRVPRAANGVGGTALGRTPQRPAGRIRRDVSARRLRGRRRRRPVRVPLPWKRFRRGRARAARSGDEGSRPAPVPHRRIDARGARRASNGHDSLPRRHRCHGRGGSETYRRRVSRPAAAH
jgi:hypothetical protein